MHILEHGQGQEKTLLFLPCTAEPVWAFEKTVARLAQSWHVFQVVYDGHEPSYPGDFTSVEQTVDEITDYLRAQGVTCLDAAYGCSLGGACLTRLLALGELPVKRAIIDGGITPYQKKEYDAIEAYLKTYSDQTIRNIFWSGNNYVLPKMPAKIGTKITYWYGDEEKKDRRSNIRFIKHYFPQARIHGIPKMAHAELVMISPEEFCRYFDKFMCR